MYEDLKLAVDLFINSGKEAQSWVTRFLAINAAQFSAIAVIIGWDYTARYPELARATLVTICIIAGLSSFYMLGVIWRQFIWLTAHQNLVMELQKRLNICVQPERPSGGFLQRNFILFFGALVLLAWMVLAGIFFQAAPFVPTSK